ncbi:MAG: OB-fold domain-containing protein [Ideonella sp.]|nr:OB-fold domain-containing protein [Ideonella sp.]
MNPPIADRPVACDDPAAPRCWTRGGADLVFQHCAGCGHRWYFHRDFCPRCGATGPLTQRLGGGGEVHASTLVHRAPSDEFRAIAPYRVVLVQADEGIRVMAHGDPGLAIGDRVRGSVRQVAGRWLPYFEKDTLS